MDVCPGSEHSDKCGSARLPPRDRYQRERGLLREHQLPALDVAVAPYFETAVSCRPVNPATSSLPIRRQEVTRRQLCATPSSLQWLRRWRCSSCTPPPPLLKSVSASTATDS